MSDAGWFRDSTQIILPRGSLDGLRADLEQEFTLTLVERTDTIRIIGSPVEIKSAGEWLVRQGVAVP